MASDARYMLQDLQTYNIDTDTFAHICTHSISVVVSAKLITRVFCCHIKFGNASRAMCLSVAARQQKRL